MAHNDFVVLDEAAERLKEVIATYPGTGDITDNYTLGKREVKARLKPEARTLGITEEDLGRQLRGAFYGDLALRLLRGTDEVEVRVKLPEAERNAATHMRMVHDEYIWIARRLIASGMDGRIGVHLTDVEKLFPGYSDLLGAQPVALERRVETVDRPTHQTGEHVAPCGLEHGGQSPVLLVEVAEHD